MPPSLPAYRTLASVGLKAMACWSGWIESPVGFFAEMFVQSQPPFGRRPPRCALIPPRYTTSGLFGATVANQSYHAWPVCRSGGGVTAVNAPPNVDRRQTYGLGIFTGRFGRDSTGSSTCGGPAANTYTTLPFAGAWQTAIRSG